MNVTTIRQGLATRLATVTGLAVNSDGLAPGQVTPPSGKPVAVITPDPGTFIVRDTQGPTGYVLTFIVKLLVGTQLTEAAQKNLDGYLDAAFRAVGDDTVSLGGGGEFAEVATVRGYGATEYAGVVYPVSAELVVGVAAQ